MTLKEKYAKKESYGFRGPGYFTVSYKNAGEDPETVKFPYEAERQAYDLYVELADRVGQDVDWVEMPELIN